MRYYEVMAMKNNYILSYNLNGWCPVDRSISYEGKIRNFSSYVKELYGEPLVIMLQEVLAGKNQKFLNLLRTLFSGYVLITPDFDYDTHYRSIMTVTLIRNDALKGYTVQKFDSELPNRTNYLIANIEGKEYRLINTHIVQTVNFKNKAAWYIEERKRLKEKQWELLLAEAESNKNSKVIIGGDMQEAPSGKHLKELAKIGYGKLCLHHATVNNDFFYGNDDCIDQIIFSNSASLEMKPIAVFVDNIQIGIWSDHALIFAACS